MKNILWFLLLFPLQIFAQVGDFLPTQKTISLPFGLPIKIDPQGGIDYVTGGRDLVFSPAIQFGLDKSFVQYSIPELATEFSLRSPSESSGWMEYKRTRYDYGAGLQALVQTNFRLGLVPYKGARRSMRRLKIHKDALTSNDISMPKTLEEMESWSVGDEGTYQTYGGIQVYAGVSVNVINAVSGSIGWQNQFIVGLQKTKVGITLSITEEKLERRSLTLGPNPLYLSRTYLKGKQLKAQFALEFSNPLHHELYLAALRGELTKLEDSLPAEKKKLSWVGKDLSAYWGVPFLYGQTRSQGSYEVVDDKQDYFLEVISSKESGLLVPTSLQHKFVYHNSESILLMWTTDMKKSSPGKLRKYFFGPARAVGFTGFDFELSEKHYGTIIGEVGLVLTKSDVSEFTKLSSLTISSGLKFRCEELKLSCAKDLKNRVIMNRYELAMKSSWDLRKKQLGILLVKEPALLHALLKETRLNKEAYFKFLSDRYQSLEGLTVLAL